mmetsp:Transcript_15823/g.23815  ORF Transcript_15823/g.23815 Transcript_15823/m.23815 type:complete len:266 (-) Transcript_15823:181-978(-)
MSSIRSVLLWILCFTSYIRTALSIRPPNVGGWYVASHTVGHLMKVMRDRGKLDTIVEIGVHHGKSFIHMANHLPDTALAVAIDVFDMQHLNHDHSGNGSLHIFTQNLKDHCTLNMSNIVIHQGDSLAMSEKDISELLNGRRVSLFSIDGCHSYDCTRHDLALAFSVLSPGGLIMVDDIFKPNWPGVLHGVVSFLDLDAGGAIVPIAFGDNKYYLTWADSADDWLTIFREWCTHFRRNVRDPKRFCTEHNNTYGSHPFLSGIDTYI